jgi:hypothetical protein
MGCHCEHCILTGRMGFNRSATARKAYIQPRGRAWYTLTAQYAPPTVTAVLSTM